MIDKRPHVRKVRHFLNIYPHALIENKYKFKFPLILGGKACTYNPDYFCPATGYFIEVTTSVPNMSEQGDKWQAVIDGGHMLKVFWWEGDDYIDRFSSKVNGKKGGRPKKTL